MKNENLKKKKQPLSRFVDAFWMNDCGQQSVAFLRLLHNKVCRQLNDFNVKQQQDVG